MLYSTDLLCVVWDVFNTTNMMLQLINRHPAQMSDFTAAPLAKTLRQPTLKNKQKLPEDIERIKKITTKTAGFIALDDIRFHRLMEQLEQRCELPSRHHFTALPVLYNRLRDLLVLINHVSAFGFSADIWSSFFLFFFKYWTVDL